MEMVLSAFSVRDVFLWLGHGSMYVLFTKILSAGACEECFFTVSMKHIEYPMRKCVNS